MSRSRRKTPIVSITTSKSDKDYKKYRASKERRIVRDKLRLGDIEDLHNEQVEYDDWATDKDGKQYLLNLPKEELEKLMRK